MSAIKPGLGHETSVPVHSSSPHTVGVTREERGTVPPRRLSPLREHIAVLLQRQREQQAAAHAGADLNRVHLTGRLGSEPLLYDVGDHPNAALTLVSERHYLTGSGALQVEAIWFNLSASEELADYCGRSLHKHDRVYVEGYLHLWTEIRPPASYGCHTIVLDRIVLLSLASLTANVEDKHQ